MAYQQFCETLDHSLCTRFPSRVITLEKEQLTVRVRTFQAAARCVTEMSSRYRSTNLEYV